MDIKDFHVETWLNMYENDCKYNLSETFPHALTVGGLLELTGRRDELAEELMNITLDYGEIVGSERLRRAVSGLYKNVPEDRITIAHGTIGANSLVLTTIVRPGDHVIAVSPSYQQLYSLPESIGADVTVLRLKEENGWLLDIDELRAAVTDKTRLICLNNPNNPTGAVMPVEMMREIADIAEKHGAYIFCDEAYRGLSHDGRPDDGSFFAPSFIDIYDKAIVTGGMSKTFALAGLRLGWVAGPKDIIDDINRHRDYHIISVGKMDELLAAIAIENRDAVLSRNIEICRENLAVIDKWIAGEPHVSYVKPSSATTCFMKFDFDMTSTELCHRLREEAGVLFVPGCAFESDDHFRLGFGNPKAEIEAGLAAFSEWMKNNIK